MELCFISHKGDIRSRWVLSLVEALVVTVGSVKVVAVTGGGRGIGREIALLAAREGASVVVNDLGGSQDGEGRDAGPAEAVVAEIRAAGGQATVKAAHISDTSPDASIVDDALGPFGTHVAVVNTAGIMPHPSLRKMKKDDR